MTATLLEPLNTDRVADLVGATYRQVDYWVRAGVLTPRQPYSGSGSRRTWTPVDLRVAGVVAQLRRMGAPDVAYAAAAARLYQAAADLPPVDAGWIVVTPLRLFPAPVVELVDDLDRVEDLAGAGAWVIAVPDLIG